MNNRNLRKQSRISKSNPSQFPHASRVADYITSKPSPRQVKELKIILQEIKNTAEYGLFETRLGYYGCTEWEDICLYEFDPKDGFYGIYLTRLGYLVNYGRDSGVTISWAGAHTPIEEHITQIEKTQIVQTQRSDSGTVFGGIVGGVAGGIPGVMVGALVGSLFD